MILILFVCLLKTLENSRSNTTSFLRTTICHLYRTTICYFNTSSSSSSTATADDESVNETRLRSQRHPRHRRKKENSDKYFIVLFWLFVCVKISYDFFILIPVLVVMWRMVRRAFILVVSMVGASDNVAALKHWFTRRRKILAPRPFLIVANLFRKGDHKCTQLISASMDTIVTAFIMISLVLAVICSVIILCIQVKRNHFENQFWKGLIWELSK